MAAKDGLLVRCRPPGGVLSSEQLHILAQAAEAYGNGLVDLTGQARLQIRGLSEATLAAFVETMVRAGLASADPAREARRRVTVLPGGDAELGAEIETALIRAALAAPPPRPSPQGGGRSQVFAEKFDIGIGVDGAPDADIMLHKGRLWLAGATQAARVTDPCRDVLRLVAWLDGRRMRAAVASVGEAMAYRAADLVAQCDIPKPQKMADGVGIPYGRMNVAMLHLLARIGARYGNGNWQVMRSRALILGEVTDPAALAEEAQAGGLIARADDPRRRISACTGRSGCASATVDTRQDADALQSALPPLATLHVSGCPKGCAHPGSADFTLVGTASGYDLVRNGRAGDAPASRGLTLTEARAHLRAAAL